MVTKLDRLARSLPDARAIAEELTRRQVRLSLGGSVYDPHDPVGRLLFNVLAMVAEFEADLIRLRTREGMRVAKAKGKLRGKQPKLNPRQEAHLVDLHRQGEHSTAELADLFGIARSTVYRALQRTKPAARRTVTGRRSSARALAGELHRRQAQRCPAGQTRSGASAQPPGARPLLSHWGWAVSGGRRNGGRGGQ